MLRLFGIKYKSIFFVYSYNYKIIYEENDREVRCWNIERKIVERLLSKKQTRAVL